MTSMTKLISICLLSLALAACCAFAQPDPAFAAELESEWVTMTVEEELQFFTKYEVCMVKSHKHSDKCGHYRAQIDAYMNTECSLYGAGFGHVNGACRPLDSLRRHKSTLQWPKGGNVLSIIKQMKDKGSNTFIIIGDSLTQQHFTDAYCGLKRYGLPVQRIDFNYDKNQLTNHIFIGDPHLSDASPDQYKYAQVIERPYATEKLSPLTVTKNLINAILNGTDKNSFPVTGRVVFLANTGIHFHSGAHAAELEKTYRLLFQYLLDLHSAGHLVIFRETAAQHFPTVDGQYESPSSLKTVAVPDDSLHNINTMAERILHSNFSADKGVEIQFPDFRGCSPFANQHAYDQQNWRNVLAQKVLKEVDPQGVIHFVPFFRASASIPWLHIGNGDCTHFCHHSLVWQPIWQGVHEIVGKHL